MTNENGMHPLVVFLPAQTKSGLILSQSKLNILPLAHSTITSLKLSVYCIFYKILETPFQYPFCGGTSPTNEPN